MIMVINTATRIKKTDDQPPFLTRPNPDHFQLTNSEISADLIANYKVAAYRTIVDTNIITFHIGQYSSSLYQLLTQTKHQCAAYITAFNPLSQQQSHQENLARNAQLHAILAQHTNLIFEGTSTDPVNCWPAEQSFLILGVSLETVKTLGKQFGQNAVVWIDTNAIPQLILLR